MFKSLQARLLTSYAILLAILLSLLAVALIAVAALSSNERSLPAVRELAVVSNRLRREIGQRRAAGTSREELGAQLASLGEEQGVRILLINSGARTVLFDSAVESNWVGASLAEMRRVTTLLRTADDQLAGRFQAPDGSSWLVYVQPLALRSDELALAVAQPDVAAGEFFRQVFLRPLCLAGLLASLVALLMAYLISRSVSRPLRQLDVAAAAIARGDISQRATVGGPAEVRSAAASFNTMADQVLAAQQGQRAFVANVSHDLKTPLTAIQGWSQALVEGVLDSAAEQQRAAGVIHAEAERMSRLVDQLLDLARIDAGQLTLKQEPVDVGLLLTEIHENLALRAEDKGIFFTIALQAVPPILGDRDRLMQMFTNLADNALTFTPTGGRVHLDLRPVNEQAIVVTVQDTGPGIDQAELSRIFERFYQTDPSRKRSSERRGAGLGLAIVSELVAAHGGRIEARSRQGEGSAFLVHLPAKPAGTTVARRSRG